MTFHTCLRTLLCLSFVALVSSQAVYDRHGCPDGWVTFEDSCYLFADTQRMDWTEGTHFCTAHFGSYLTVIDSPAEDAFLQDFCKRLFKHDRTAVFWIGATDDVVEGVWVWYPDHRRVSSGYHNWHPGQPDNIGDQDCGCLEGNYEFVMSDGHCDAKEHLICEKNFTSGALAVVG